MPPRKGKKTTEAAPPEVVTEAGMNPTPVTGLPDLGSMDPSKVVGPGNSPNLLEQTPGLPNPIGGDSNTVTLDGVNLNLPGLPSAADLQKDLQGMLGTSASGSLGDNMLPVLTARVDQLRESLTTVVKDSSEALIQEFNARLNALTTDVLHIKKGQANLQTCINEEVLPSLVRIEGFLQAWAADDGDTSAQAVVAVQEAAVQVHPAAQTQAPPPAQVQAQLPPALEQQQQVASPVSSNVQKWVALYANHFSGNAMDATQFANQLLQKHASEFVPATDTQYNLIAYLRSLGWYNDKNNTVTFPAVQG